MAWYYIYTQQQLHYTSMQCTIALKIQVDLVTVSGLGLKVQCHTQLVASGIDVAALDQSRERELDTGTQVLAVGKAYLSLVVHLGLRENGNSK